MTAAVSAYSTILSLSDGGGTPVYTPIAEVRSIGDIGGERDMLEVTHMESPGRAKEFIAGMLDSMMCSLELNYLPQNATHMDMLTNLKQQTLANIFRTYRIHLPDFGADTQTATVSTGTWTTGGTHGWNTTRPFTFTTSGTLPTTSPTISVGTIYWLRRASGTTVKIYPTSADALADTNQITGGTGGSGTHTMNAGSIFTFTGAFKSAKPSGSANDVLKISTQIKVTGIVTFPS